MAHNLLESKIVVLESGYKQILSIDVGKGIGLTQALRQMQEISRLSLAFSRNTTEGPLTVKDFHRMMGVQVQLMDSSYWSSDVIERGYHLTQEGVSLCGVPLPPVIAAYAVLYCEDQTICEACTKELQGNHRERYFERGR